MQTVMVHNRRPGALLRDLGWRGFLAFQIYIASMLLSAPLHTVFLIALMLTIITGEVSGTGLPTDVFSIVIIGIGYGGALTLAVAGLWRAGRPDLISAQLLLPLYWMLHSVAAVLAVHQLLTRPYFWSKTRHGRTRISRTSAGDKAVSILPSHGLTP